MSTKLWYNEFIDDWMWALPLGNGRIGAMVYGNPDCEQIEINEESLWSGRQIQEQYHASLESLAQIRKLLSQEKLEEAAALARETFLSDPPVVRSYESFGEIFIDFFDKSPYTDYHKELELSQAICRTSWKRSGAIFRSECFVSEDYDGFVYNIHTDGKPFSCNVSLKRKQDAFSACLNDNTIILNGKVCFATHHYYGEGGEGMSFYGKLKIKTDGKLTVNHSYITVTDGTYLTVFGAFETNYNPEKFDIDESINYKEKATACIEKLYAETYESLKKNHIASHQKWFASNELKLEETDISKLPTNQRIKELRWDEYDPDLFALYYNFGRYLLIESSGKNARLPANLQGIWCHDFNPPWGSDFHTNINLQMNYWPAECTNLSETTIPFIHFMKMVSSFGSKTAKELFGARGWVINHTTDAFGRTGVHDSVDCGFFPMAGPWLCLNLWEHYEYTEDVDYLKEIYPILKGSCEFVEDYLIEDENGYLITSPSNSPENEFYYTDENGEKKESMFTQGATIDFQIIYALFTRTAHACKVLNIDNSFAEELFATLKKLPPMEISERYGTIREWCKDYEETDPGHRHISHLFGLFPADQINENNPEIYEAAKRTIARRIENGGGSTGWSRAWTVCFYSRLKDGENALKHLKYLLKKCTAYNLFDIHPPFQIDGNFGGITGITEMLIHSHLGSPDERITELLPALPEEWKTGSVKGVRARGGFTFDLIWDNGKLKEFSVTADSCSTLKLQLNDRVFVPQGYNADGSIISIPLNANETKTFTL